MGIVPYLKLIFPNKQYTAKSTYTIYDSISVSDRLCIVYMLNNDNNNCFKSTNPFSGIITLKCYKYTVPLATETKAKSDSSLSNAYIYILNVYMVQICCIVHCYS